VLTSLIPLALLVLAVAGFLEVEELWTEDLALQFEAQVSEEVYAVADEVVRRTLGDEQLFWLTVGLVFTVGASESASSPALTQVTCATPRRSRHTRAPTPGMRRAAQ
jgi:uncharacterized BrkB/YihY/UPF0761 family membrane protein